MEKVKDIYYDPKTGYIGLNSLQKKLIENGIYLSYDEIKNWYKDQQVNQIYKEGNYMKSYHTIKAPLNMVGCFQMDLMITERFYKQNKGYKYILNIIDVYSRMAFSFLLKTKTPKEVAPHVEKVIQLTNNKVPLFFTTDNGTEFLGEVEELFEKYNVMVYVNDPNSSNAKHITGIVERFNRTLWNRIRKYMYAHDTLTYYDVLDDLVYNYNNTVHSTIKVKPIDVWSGKVKPENINENNVETIEFQIGDKVRHKKVHQTFTKKGFEPVYSIKTYTVEGKLGNKYLLSNGKYYLPDQLNIATSSTENTFNKTLKDNKLDIKKERVLKDEFKMPIQEIEKQVLTGKRIKKQPVRYTDWT